jgi:hypothetical protein
MVQYIQVGSNMISATATSDRSVSALFSIIIHLADKLRHRRPSIDDWSDGVSSG